MTDRVGSMYFAAAALVLAASPAPAQTAAPLSGLVAQHMTLSVADIARESAWYTRVLGFTLQPHNDANPDYLNYHMTIPGYRIDLIQFKGSSRPAASDPLYARQGWIHLAFTVPQLSGAFEQLKTLGTDVKGASNQAGGAISRLVLHDPEGNEIELFQQ